MVPGGAPHVNSLLEHCSPGQVGIWIEVGMCNLAFMPNSFIILSHTEVFMLKNISFFAQNGPNRNCTPAHLCKNRRRALVNVQKIRKSFLEENRGEWLDWFMLTGSLW